MLSREDVEVADRPAVRIEARATGEGLYEKGLLVYVYVVDRTSRPPLVLQTFRAPRSRWVERKAVLDNAARTLVLFRPGAQPEGGPVTQAPLPVPVARKRAALLAAATRRDYEQLEELADPREFHFTFGNGEGGPAAYWRELESNRLAPAWASDPSPAEALAAILEMQYTVDAPASDSGERIYVWPFAYDKEPGALTPDEAELLAPIASARELEQMAQFGSYIDWRAGITADGRWIFFVAGD